MNAIIRMIGPKDGEKIEKLFLAKNSRLKWDYLDFYYHPDCFGEVVVAEGGEIAGFGSLIRYHTPLHGIIGRLEDIFVHPDHQGRGYGKKIVIDLIDLGKQLRFNQIVLTGNPSRAAARHIYLSLGFDLYETGVFVKNL